jgi:glycosyltransferase involved in cell wall biosynthesis
VKIYAVIPTHNRHADLAELLGTIPADVDVLVIDNASDRDAAIENSAVTDRRFIAGHNTEYRWDDEQPPNLSRLWNIGLDWAHTRDHNAVGCAGIGDGNYAVAILNDDVVLPPRLLHHLADELTYHDVDIAFPGSVGLQCYVNKGDPFPGVGLRLTGWCFIVRGSSGLRADESLRWWCGDDGLQAQAVENGRGTVAVMLNPDMAESLRHKHPDESTTGVLREQTEKDMATFVAKWGRRPW